MVPLCSKYRTLRVYRLTVHGILRVVGDSSAVPKILNIPKRGEHAKAEGSAVRLAESSAVEIDYFPNAPPENGCSMAGTSRQGAGRPCKLRRLVGADGRV